MPMHLALVNHPKNIRTSLPSKLVSTYHQHLPFVRTQQHGTFKKKNPALAQTPTPYVLSLPINLHKNQTIPRLLSDPPKEEFPLALSLAQIFFRVNGS